MSLETIELDGVKYVKQDSIKEKADKVDGLECVLIRTYSAGVHFGYLKSEKFTESGKVVELVNSRRVHYWDGAASLSQMASEGVKKPNNCRVTVPVDLELVGVIETLLLTKEAKENLYSINEWRSE